MDIDDMLGREEDVEIHLEGELPMTSQLQSFATLCSVEPGAMDDIERIIVGSTTPST
jgi:hypothetical protein